MEVDSQTIVCIGWVPAYSSVVTILIYSRKISFPVPGFCWCSYRESSSCISNPVSKCFQGVCVHCIRFPLLVSLLFLCTGVFNANATNQKFVSVLLTFLQNGKPKINSPVSLIYGVGISLLLKCCPIALFLHGTCSQRTHPFCDDSSWSYLNHPLSNPASNITVVEVTISTCDFEGMWKYRPYKDISKYWKNRGLTE